MRSRGVGVYFKATWTWTLKMHDTTPSTVLSFLEPWHPLKIKVDVHIFSIQIFMLISAVLPEFRTTGLSGICILKRTRKDGYRWDERE